MHADTAVVDRLDRELAGLDHLEVSATTRRPLALRIWVVAWPKVAAIAFVIAIWQFAVWREWKPRFVLPSPLDVGRSLWSDLGEAELWRAVAHTMRRAIVGFTVSLIVGGAVGLAVSRSRVLRVAVGSDVGVEVDGTRVGVAVGGSSVAVSVEGTVGDGGTVGGAGVLVGAPGARNVAVATCVGGTGVLVG